MSKKMNKAEICAADPNTLSSSNLKKWVNWEAKGETKFKRDALPQGNKQMNDATLVGKKKEEMTEEKQQEIADKLKSGEIPDKKIGDVPTPPDTNPDTIKDIGEEEKEEEVVDDGIDNVKEPLEYTEEVEQAVIEKEKRDQKQVDEFRAASKVVENKVNLWKVITYARNDYAGYEHRTMAMKLGNKGILVCVKENINNQVSVALEYLPNAELTEVNGKWQIN